MVHWWVLVHCGPATTLKAFGGQVFTSVGQLLLFDPGNWSGLGPGINNPPVRYCLLKPGKQLTHPVLNFQILITYLDDPGMISIKHVYKRQFRNRKYIYKRVNVLKNYNQCITSSITNSSQPCIWELIFMYN